MKSESTHHLGIGNESDRRKTHVTWLLDTFGHHPNTRQLFVEGCPEDSCSSNTTSVVELLCFNKAVASQFGSWKYSCSSMRFRASQFSISACVCVWNPAICLQAKWLNGAPISQKKCRRTSAAVASSSPRSIGGDQIALQIVLLQFSHQEACHLPSAVVFTCADACTEGDKILAKQKTLCGQRRMPSYNWPWWDRRPRGPQVAWEFPTCTDKRPRMKKDLHKLHASNLVILERWASLILGRHTRPNNTRIP